MKKIFALFSLALLTMSAWAANTYVKVTSIDQLEAGQKYILVNEEASVALGAITGTSTNYGSAVTITIADGVIDVEDTDAVELTLGEGSMDEFGNPTWTFDIGGEDHYICWTSGNSLNTVNNSTPSNAKWIATLTDDGVVLTSRVDATRKLQYNASDPRFACYTSSQKPAVLYVQGVPGDDGIANLNEANGLEDGDNFNFAGDAVVTVQMGDYLFLRDDSGYGLIYGTVDGDFENGKVLNQGWNATKTSVNGWVRYIDVTDISASGETNAELAAPQEANSIDESMVNAYVCYKKVKFYMLQNRIQLEDGTYIPFKNLFNLDLPGGSMFPGNNPLYDAYGVIGMDGSTVKFIPVSFDKVVVPTFLRGDVNNDNYVNITDVTVLINYLLTDDATGVNLQAADCNQNQEINISDVTALINYLLTDAW